MKPALKPRPRLDRTGVVAAAAALADELRRVDAVQLVDLAKRVGIRTPSLYAHVASLDDLRREVALLGLRELRERMSHAAVGHGGTDALMALARAVREYALERPGVYTAVSTQPRDEEWNDALLAIKDVFVTVFSRFGIEGDEATNCVRAMRSAIHGYVVLEAQGDFGLPDPAASFDRVISAMLRGLLDVAPAASRRR
ncbi:MAG TPA: TetR-like C-terminal domain-containing protein [Candidatus Elarobacter sp.]|jgi:AcrR family transcriptional regulator|nr:TetR-like C-terminal domain-containing protein [Candidatus Elarobacter sp.]